MLHFLTAPSVVRPQPLPDSWSVDTVLRTLTPTATLTTDPNSYPIPDPDPNPNPNPNPDPNPDSNPNPNPNPNPNQVLRTVSRWRPPLHALIDTGALVTGLSNLQVALYSLGWCRAYHGYTYYGLVTRFSTVQPGGGGAARLWAAACSRLRLPRPRGPQDDPAARGLRGDEARAVRPRPIAALLLLRPGAVHAIHGTPSMLTMLTMLTMAIPRSRYGASLSY